MPLSEQEARCVNLVCRHLAKVLGGAWEISDDLDETHQSAASPEVLVSNGTVTGAIEVKRLTLDVLQQYHAWKHSLERYLAPSCRGHFVLCPCMNFKLPLEKPMMRLIRKEIARIAPTIPPSASGAVRIPRDGYVVVQREDLPGTISCAHTPSSDLRAVSSRLGGSYLLVDDQNPWEHSFVSDEGRAAFHDAIIAACQTARRDGRGPLSWDEEWELMRLDEGQDEDPHFEIITVSDVFTGDTATTAVWTTLEKGRAKFHRRWASHHVLVFERAGPIITADRVAAVTAEFDEEDLGAVEMVLFVDGEDLTQVWP